MKSTQVGAGDSRKGSKTITAAKSQSPPSHHGNRGSLRQKSGIRLTSEHRSKVFPIQCLSLALKRRLPNLPDPPRRMGHAIFHATTIGLRRIPPVVLGDELFRGTFTRQFRSASGFKIDFAPALLASPSV